MGRLRRLLGKVIDLTVDAGSRPEDAQATSSALSKPAAPHPLDPIPQEWNRAIKESPVEDEGLERVRVTFTNHGSEATVPVGTTILDAAIAAGVDLNHYCGGMASCGSCRVEDVEGALSTVDSNEDTILNLCREGKRDRLGCQAQVLGDVRMTVPDQDC